MIRAILAASLCSGTLLCAASHDARRLLARDASLASPSLLPEARGRHTFVFRGKQGESGFNLHSYLAHFDGRFWAIWSSSQVGEEDPGQHILYATSTDGRQWSNAAVLAPDPDGPAGPQRWIARGVFVDGGHLRALGALVESAAYRERGSGVVWRGLKLMRFTWTGKAWEQDMEFADDCMNNFPPIRLKDRDAMPCRDSGMNLSVALAASRGGNAWKFIPLDAAPPFHRMDEPAMYVARDGTAQLLIRDGARSGYLIRSVSLDGGKSWSKPVLTNYPDATSKNFVLWLANGTYVLINNPDQKRRDPLAASFSRDGWVFDHPIALRKNAPGRRYAGRAKGSGSYQYPHAMEYGGAMWVIYSTNKEDIEISEFPLSGLLP